MRREPDIAVIDTLPLVERYAAQALEFTPRPLDSLLRAVDVVLAGMAMVAAAPLLGICALAVRVSGRPVLYRGISCRALRRDVHDVQVPHTETRSGAAPRIAAG